MKTYFSKFILSCFLVSPILLTACFYGVKGNGQVERLEQTVADFDEIEISGMFDVFLRKGSGPELEIIADENLLEFIKYNVEDGTLSVWVTEDIRRAEKMELYISYTQINRIEVSGAIDLVSKGTIASNDFKLEISGASDTKLSFDVGRLDLDLSGASDMWLSGKVSEMNADISGAVDLDAYELETRDMDIDLSGAGSAKVWVTDRLNVEVSGAGSVRYKGSPRVSKDVSGAGSVKAIN